ncbi:MAG: serine protease [Bdellovibrionota bacterium]
MKNIFLSIVMLSMMLFQVQAQANWDIRNVKKPAPRAVLNSLSKKKVKSSETDKYQIGSEWGKKVVTKDSLKNESDVFQKTALRTAKFGSFMGSGTAFYLGKFNGKHIMASNYHVITTADDCKNGRAEFTMIGKIFSCAEFLGSWSDVDYSLVAIKVKPEDEAVLEGLGQNMAWDSKPYKGQKLLTIGHGFANNPSQKLVSNQDEDCMTYSEETDVRFMADPDDVNPGDYKVWSFANGCDVSHGDSGSAMVDRNTGEMVGIIWTGRIPKDKKVQDSTYLSDIYHQNSEDVWKQLSYSAPAFKIKEVLSKYLDDKELSVDTEKTIRQILN